jgi:hypothetical protein
MPTPFATVYVTNPGDAMVEMQNLMNAALPAGQFSAVVVEWTDAYTAPYTAFYLKMIKPDTSYFDYAIGVLASGYAKPMPIQYVVKASNFCFNMTLGTLRAPGVDASGVAAQVVAALKDCLEDLCDATIVDMGDDSFVPSGATRPYIAFSAYLAKTTNDALLCVNSFLDTFAPPSSPMAVVTQNCPTYNAPGGVLLMGATSGGSAPPLDVDVAINNGSSIFSISSSTFTEP